MRENPCRQEVDTLRAKSHSMNDNRQVVRPAPTENREQRKPREKLIKDD